ncbi:MAG: D-alanyl-D-alanine carboxypeptidase family protein [Lachnospiraceae bacterium]|nr:D-alanyl-D-alanine carboxypeptidase family protein [Lachnospiraceae bacterium]
MKRLSSILICITIVFSLTFQAVASPKWAEYPPQEVQAEGACLMDARSGAVLYGKNMHSHYFPASITKILTALVVLENCDNLEETLVFSHRAVYDVEANSSSAGYDEGDEVTVRTALYAMLLASANEAANALAEYVGGTIEGFCDMMNEKARQLGCTDSHFANPSGLNNPDHYTSAYDFCLISRAAFANDTFVQIDGSTYYTLPPMKRNPEEAIVYTHHNMLKKNSGWYYEGIVGGKTGYTSLAGNTLVTCAQRDETKLVSVVLNGHQTHYEDTKLLLDFGFENFTTVSLSDYKTKYDTVLDPMDIAGMGVKNADVITTSRDACITLPIGATPDDVDTDIVYDLDAGAPREACAKIIYRYADKTAGEQYVLRQFEYSETEIVLGEPVEKEEVVQEQPMIKKTRDWFLETPVWAKILMIAGFAAVVGGIVLLIVKLLPKRRRR